MVFFPLYAYTSIVLVMMPIISFISGAQGTFTITACTLYAFLARAAMRPAPQHDPVIGLTRTDPSLRG